MSIIGKNALLARLRLIATASGARAVRFALLLLPLLVATALQAEILIPMDLTQSNHLKAYGIAFEALKEQYVAKWLLNYRGGSFLLPESEALAALCNIRGVSYEIVSSAQVAAIQAEIQ